MTPMAFNIFFLQLLQNMTYGLNSLSRTKPHDNDTETRARARVVGGGKHRNRHTQTGAKMRFGSYEHVVM